MRTVLIGACAALGVMAAAAWAAPMQLRPANPQPSGLKPGLAVTYAYPVDVKTLSDAKQSLAQTVKKGKPLKGMNYPDRGEGVKALTSDRDQVVAADIHGYIRFDQSGVYTLEFFSNDGLEVAIGGRQVADYDAREPCSSTGAVQVQVPQAGWYALSAVYFQRLGTSCLEMEWAPPGGGKKAVPNGNFGH